MAGVPLILNREPLKTSFRMVPPRLPTIAVVYATGGGDLELYGDGRPQTWMSQVRKDFAWRYEIDISVHHRTAQVQSTPLPSWGDVYFFQTTITVDFQVTDPKMVIRHNVDDALPLVYGYVLELSRRITRTHAIEDAQGAEAQIDQQFRTYHLLPQGIAILRCKVSLSPDNDARAYLRQVAEASRGEIVGSAQHQPNMNATQRAGEVEALEQRLRLERELAEQRAMGSEPLNARSLIMLHLRRFPGDTRAAYELLAAAEQAAIEQRDKNDQRWLNLIQFMSDRDLIQPVDMERFRTEGLTRLQVATATSFAATMQPGMLTAASGWDAPLAGPPGQRGPGPYASGEHPVMDFVPSANGVWEPSQGIHPIYLVMDESTALGPYADQMSSGIEQIVSTLGSYPEVAKALRLSVLGYSGDVAVRLDMATVGSGAYAAPVVGRGPARYSAAFQTLLDRIPRDVEALKARHEQVRRPLVFFFSGSQPDDAAEWSAPYRQLVNRHLLPAAPNIAAAGTGTASPSAIATIATQPNMAFFVEPGIDTAESIRLYHAYLKRMLFDHGNAILTRRSDVVIAPPQGFRLISDTV